MLELILKLYTTAMAGEVRSPVPHLFGPPGCGKSTFVEQAAELLGVTLHTINVSRISPLELEGVQMPDKDNTKLDLLHATFWTRMKDGDILLLDEFLRGFPEVYNGLLDILTSRTVAGMALPKVFIIAASNTTVAYDKALEDRLLHLPVPDPRTSREAKKNIAEVLCSEIGLLPEMVGSIEMNDLLAAEVLPMYEVLDALKKTATIGAVQINGRSTRNLAGQARLRHIVSPQLSELISMNNSRAISQGKYQYVFLLSGKNVDPKYRKVVEQLVMNPKLTEQQWVNTKLNLQLIEAEEIKMEGVKANVADPDDAEFLDL